MAGKGSKGIRISNLEVSPNGVVTVPQSSSVIDVLGTMVAYGFRRIPITNDNKKLAGLVVAMDLIDFFGGGNKHRIVENRYNGELSAAVKGEIEEIMEKDVVTIDFSQSWMDAVETMVKKNVDCCPVVDNGKVTGIITESDALQLLATRDMESDRSVEDLGPINAVAPKVITIEPKASIEEAMKIMVIRGVRRLPVVIDGVLVGLITDRDILRYFAANAFNGNTTEVLEQPLTTLLSQDYLVHREPLIFSPSVGASEVARRMIDSGLGAALITKGGVLEGIVTENDLMRILLLVQEVYSSTTLKTLQFW